MYEFLLHNLSSKTWVLVGSVCVLLSALPTTVPLKGIQSQLLFSGLICHLIANFLLTDYISWFVSIDRINSLERSTWYNSHNVHNGCVIVNVWINPNTGWWLLIKADKNNNGVKRQCQVLYITIQIMNLVKLKWIYVSKTN